jgi:two-component system, chemotaxis family, sensor kinase CheA
MQGKRITAPHFRGLSVRWKIYLIAIVSMISFGGYLGFNVWVNTENSRLLASVRDVYFPILEKSTSNSVRLERISELFNTAVLTGELDYLQTADKIADSMRADFETTLTLEPQKQADIKAIQSIFEDYYTLGKAIAEGMAMGEDIEPSALRAKVDTKEEHLEILQTRLETFRKYSHNTFTGNIDHANRNSEFTLTSGFVIWAISILLLAVTVYAIARLIINSIVSVSKSLHAIAISGDVAQNIPVTSQDEIGRLTQSFNELMEKLRERTNDLMCMMQNMHQGLFTITEEETIHKEYSSFIENIFKTKSISGIKYDDLLFKNCQIGSDQLNQVKTAVSSLLGADELMFSFNGHLLVSEYQLTLPSTESPSKIETKILELDWDPIISDGMIKKIMVTVRDVTELRAMQAAAEEQKQELDILGQIIKVSPSKFNAFIANARQLIAANKSIIENQKNKDSATIANLFVNMHTIKGNARTYQFTAITDIVHDAETTYDCLRKESDYPWNPSQLLSELAQVNDAVERFAKIKSDKLSSQTDSAAPDGHIVIAPDKYKSLLSGLQNSESRSRELALREFQLLAATPIEDVLKDLLSALPSVAEQLGKPAPHIHKNLPALFVNHESCDLLTNIFTHLLRNAIDHGIEKPDERVQKGKPERGTISLSSRHSAQGFQFVLEDDGKGLALQKLKAKAKEAGLTESQLDTAEKIANCLFLSGVSTAESVTAISGRGVGMDAVKKYLNTAGGNIDIALTQPSSSTDEFAPFKLIIHLPEKSLVAAAA